MDAVQEFKIMQNNYTAEEGFSGNTYVTLVSRSGSNNIHGDVYEFDRNKDFDSQQLVQQRLGRQAAFFAEKPVWRQRRRSDQEGQDILLL